jgi:uncharacterized membrane protein
VDTTTRVGFVRTTLVGGVLYLVPVIVLLAILGKAMELAHGISAPTARMIESAGLGRILTPQVAAVLLLVLFCFGAGLFARSAVAKRFGTFLDTKVLVYVPGYSLFKSMGESLVGVEPAGVRNLVMVSIEDAWQLAVVVDELEDGHMAVYVPDVPEGRSGALYFMTPDRVRPLTIPLQSAMLVLRRMGTGSRELLKGGIPAVSELTSAKRAGVAGQH